jgi:hypothetical protein
VKRQLGFVFFTTNKDTSQCLHGTCRKLKQIANIQVTNFERSLVSYHSGIIGVI